MKHFYRLIKAEDNSLNYLFAENMDTNEILILDYDFNVNEFLNVLEQWVDMVRSAPENEWVPPEKISGLFSRKVVDIQEV